MTLKPEPLTMEAFGPFGTFANLIDPDGVKIGAPPIEFYRDMVQQGLGGASTVSFSTCRVEKRDLVIDVTEYHTACAEGILPLDNDVLIHAGPATPVGEAPPLGRFRVFRLLRGIMAVLRPGVWHHAPISVNDDPANVLIVLPERTYANDCTVVELKPDEVIRIDI